MIHVFAALQCELQPVIQALHATSCPGPLPFRQWQDLNGSIRLTLTGTGPLQAASCVSAVLHGHAVNTDDLLLSIGTCATLNPIIRRGEVCLLNSLTDLVSQRCFYPDLLLSLPLREASILTGAQLFEKQKASVWSVDQNASLPDLYDMESAAVYAAGITCLGPHQMVFLRTVSDAGDANVTREDILALQENALPVYLQTLNMMKDFAGTYLRHDPSPAGTDNLIEVFLQDIHATQAMRLQMGRLLRYARQIRFPVEDTIRNYRSEGKLPCPSKKEGVSLLAAFEHELRFYDG